MKRKFIKFAALTLAVITVMLSLVSCSGANRPAVSLGDNSISVGMYSLMTSIFKGTLAYGNSSINSDSYWNTVVNSDGETQETVCNRLVLEMAKENLYKLALFDEKGLELPQSVIDEIDEELDFWIDYDADGSMNNFNSILAEYGANYDILREYMIMAAKIEYLGKHMYGDGSQISGDVKQKYLEENYVCFKQILLPYYRYVYETDENGDEIYYTEEGKISYDSKKGELADSDGDGKANRDKNGDIIYYAEDDKGNIRICYDKLNGTRKYKYDESGNEVTEEFNDSEKSEVWNRAQKVFSEIQAGNFSGFEVLIATYDDNYGDEGAQRVYLNTGVEYSTVYSDGVVDELADAASELEVGEAAKLETDYGIHIIMRYSFEDAPWENEDYKGYFEDDTGVLDFDNNLIKSLFMAEIEKIKDRVGEITVDTEAIAEVSIKNIGINYNFY